MAAELIVMKVDVFVSASPATNYVADMVTTIPHVFMMVPDPVRQKFVESLARPGGNTTGVSNYSLGLVRKRVQLLRQTLPQLSRVGLLINSKLVGQSLIIDEGQKEATELGLTLRPFEASTLGELEPAFDMMANSGIQGLVLGGSGLLWQGRTTVAKLATAHRLPTCAWEREILKAGTLLSYGSSLADIVRRAPIYVDKILKGAKPADLPVEQPTKFELLINLKVANAIGIEVPQMLLAQADEVIE